MKVGNDMLPVKKHYEDFGWWSFTLLAAIFLFGPILVRADVSYTLGGASGSPGDYQAYFGNVALNGSITAATAGNCPSITASIAAGAVVMATGTVDKVLVTVIVASTLPTTESGGVYICKNGTRFSTLSASSSPLSAANRFNRFYFNNVAMPVVTGDVVSVGYLTPAWATNPTAVSFTNFITVTDTAATSGSSASSTTSTSTVVTNPNQDIHMLYLIFLASMFFVVWLLRRPV